jgi:hypothetical protein
VETWLALLKIDKIKEAKYMQTYDSLDIDPVDELTPAVSDKT